MSETPEELHARAAGRLLSPPVQEWDTWPFEGPVTPRVLQAPSAEHVRHGEDPAACPACAKGDDAYVWTDDHWRLMATEPSGLPVVLMLEPRGHYDGPAELPEELAREQGVMLGRVERAVLAVDGVARVHIGRWGEGLAHLHWWFIARPAGFTQLASSMAEIWSDVLPPTPQAIWDGNVARVVAALQQP